VHPQGCRVASSAVPPQPRAPHPPPGRLCGAPGSCKRPSPRQLPRRRLDPTQLSHSESRAAPACTLPHFTASSPSCTHPPLLPPLLRPHWCPAPPPLCSSSPNCLHCLQKASPEPLYAHALPQCPYMAHSPLQKLTPQWHPHHSARGSAGAAVLGTPRGRRDGGNMEG